MPEDRENDHGNDRESLKEIEAAFKLNIGNSVDKMFDVITGNYHTPRLPNEPDKITKHIKESEAWHEAAALRRSMPASADAEERRGGVTRKEDYRTVATASYHQASAPTYNLPARYASVLKELERFAFSEDEEKRERQMETVVGAIRTALHELVIRDVANNTKKALKDDVTEVFKIGGGIKVVFNFEGEKISVSARGPFTGDEMVVVYRKGDKKAGGVIRVDENSSTDLSANFGITLGE
jgi:hypothetical protein